MSRALSVPELRIHTHNARPIDHRRDYVLYWMTAHRRVHDNFALDRAIELAIEIDKPLLIFEPLRADYRWASDRFHSFVIDGMRDNAAASPEERARYVPFVEKRPGQVKRTFSALVKSAAAVVGDYFPAFFLPKMIAAASEKIRVHFEAIDSNGLFPLQAAPQTFKTAHAFRRHLQRELPKHLLSAPAPAPLKSPRAKKLADARTIDLPIRSKVELPEVGELPIDHDVRPLPLRGGSKAAERVLKRFLEDKLDRYAAERSDPDAGVASGLSPYLHFGHISPHRIFRSLAEREGWTPERIASRTIGGSKQGWWGMSEAAESFLDELVTWRELGFNMCETRRDDYDRWESLPDWSRATLERHARDEREHRYTLEEFERGETHDPLWNAAQRQLVEEGFVQNYLRMLWGKKILEWSAHPRDALATMIELNNKYAIDGRDPNSYSGIFWVLGRYDRPWGPERPIFGTVRYMSSESAKRKLKLREYLARWS